MHSGQILSGQPDVSMTLPALSPLHDASDDFASEFGDQR